MKFLNLEWYWILLVSAVILSAIVLTINLFARHKKFSTAKNEFQHFANFHPVDHTKSFFIQITLVVVATISVSLMILRPVFEEGSGGSVSSNLDVTIAFDVSKSMKAEDFGSRKESRLEGSKEFLVEFVQENPANRYSLVTFENKAFVDLPLTFDVGTVITGIKTINPVPWYLSKGTNLAEALENAIKTLSTDNPNFKNRQKVILLISDGERIGDDNSLSGIHEEARKKNIKIVTLGAGTTTGAKIPEYEDEKTGKVTYIRHNGKEVVSKLDESTLESISRKGEGFYMQIGDTKEDIEELSRELTSYADEDLQDDTEGKTEIYYILAVSSLLLLTVFEYGLFSKIKIKHKK